MNLQEFAAKHDLTSEMMTDPVGYFVKVNSILSGIHKTLTASEEKKAGGVEKAVEVVSQDEETVRRTETVAHIIRETIFSSIHEDDENVSVLLPKILDEIRKEVVAVRTVAMAGIEIPDVAEEENDEETDELIEEAMCAAQILEQQPATLLAMNGLSLSDLPANMVGTRKNGEQYVKLPHGFSASSLTKKSNGEVAEKKGAGRPLSTASWTFTLDDEKLPVVPLDVLAIKFCSTYTERVSGSDLRDWYKNRTNLDFPTPPETNTVEMRVPKGILRGEFATKK